MCHVCIITGLEYKFLVKSVDPDGTTSVTGKQNEPGYALASLKRDFHEEGEEAVKYRDQGGEMTRSAPKILEEKEILPNRTGNDNYDNYFSITHQHKLLAVGL